MPGRARNRAAGHFSVSAVLSFVEIAARAVAGGKS
jgi:hypothetical protein